jgi:hypothetical protein
MFSYHAVIWDEVYAASLPELCMHFFSLTQFVFRYMCTILVAWKAVQTKEPTV